MAQQRQLYLYSTNLSASQAPWMGTGVTECKHGALSGSNTSFRKETDPSPNSFQTAWGWIQGTKTIPDVSPMNFGVAVPLAGNWTASNRPALINPDSGRGDSWVYGPLEGTFNNDPWQFTASFGCTSAGSQNGRFILIAFKAGNAQGSGSTILSASYVNSASTAITDSFIYTTVGNTALAATTNHSKTTMSFVLPITVFKQEYLLFKTYYMVSTVGAAVGNNALMELGALSASITSSNFVQQTPLVMFPDFDDLG